MMELRWVARAALAAVLSASFAATPACAQGFPSKPIKAIVPLAAGGALDVMVRAIGKAQEERGGPGFVVENRAGANTILAANACKAAAPDGYTICLLSRSSVSLNPEIYKNLSYDPLKDFEPITNVAFAQQVVILNRAVPVGTFQELVAYSKANPDKLNYGSFGVGGDTHLVMEWLKYVTGAKLTHIPYKGASEALMAFTAGDVQVMYLIVGNLDLVRQINEGEVKGLLVPGAARNPLIPNVPSFAESGLPPNEDTILTWFGFFAPKGTPPDIVQALNKELTAIINTLTFRDKFLTPRGFTAVGNSVADFAAFLPNDRKAAAGMVAISGIRLEQ